MALTMTQIKEICDYVAAQSSNPDTYNSESNPMRLYYITVTEQGAKVYKKDDDIVAIFGKRNLPYTEGTEVESYVTSVVYDNTTPVNGLESVYWKGIGANLSVKTLIRNIGVFLGVNISANIDKENPVMYDEMVSICRSHIDDINKIPYYICKTSTTTYHTYVPLDILVDMAIYLRESGLYNSGSMINNPGWYRNISKFFSQSYYDLYKQYLKPISYDYDLMSKEKFYKWFIRYFSSQGSTTESENELALNALDETFGTLINYNKVLLADIGKGGSGATEFLEITLHEFPTSCNIALSGYEKGITGLRNGINIYSTFYNRTYYVNSIEDFTYIKYNVKVEIESGTITQSYNVYEKVKDTIYNITTPTRVCNVNFNKNFKGYRQWYKYTAGSNATFEVPDYYANLQNNVVYPRNSIKLCGLETVSMYDEVLRQVLETNLNIGQNDLLILLNTSPIYAIVCRNIPSIKSDAIDLISYLRSVYLLYSREGTSTPEDLIINYRNTYDLYDYMPYNNLVNKHLIFESDTQIDTYIIKPYDTYHTDWTYDITSVDSVTTSNYTITIPQELVDMSVSSLYGFLSNIGEIVEYSEPESYNGFELIPNSTYPKAVIDTASFRSLYNRRSYVDIHQPVIIDDIVQADQISSTTWVNCSVSKTPPATQSDSEDWNIDDASPEDQEKIVDDIDASSNDEDEDEDENNDDGKDDATDSGEVEEIPAELVPNTLIGSLRQYKMNASEMINFSAGLSALDFGDVVQALIYGNPINGVVNMATTYDGLWNSTNSQDNTQVKVWNNNLENDSTPVTATLITQPIKEIDLGTINLATNTEIQEFVHDNYTDLTDCEIGLYLPFVGIINIDIHDFYKKELTLKARVDSTTGTIIYNVYSEGDNFKHLIYTCSGNCQSKIPLKSEDMSQLLRNIGNAAVGVSGAMLGGII